MSPERVQPAVVRPSPSRPLVLLGPQRLQPTVREALMPLVGPGEPVAAVTAGWEERESEQGELRDHLVRPVENLELYRRAEEVFAEDPELHEALRQRHGDLHALQTIYRLRLRHLVPAVRVLLRRAGPEALMEPEREAAFENLRALDEHHLGRIAEVRQAFQEEWQPSERPAVARQRAEIAAILERCAALCVAGGHVRILHTRLRLFDLAELLPERMPLLAWSAGAMALADRIVLFHDHPPQGRGFPEVLGPGLGLCPGVVPLPHARQRLSLDNEVRVQLLSRRFPDAVCVALDANSAVTWNGSSWTGTESTLRLTETGALATVGEA